MCEHKSLGRLYAFARKPAVSRSMTVARLEFLLIVSIFAIVGGTCPQGALQGLTANDCYLYLPPNFWLSALEDCVQRGGQLASVSNAFVNLFIPTLPKETCGVPYSAGVHSYWLGGSVGLTSSSWSWSDSSPFAYTAWDNGMDMELALRHVTLLPPSRSAKHHVPKMSCDQLNQRALVR